MRLAPPLPAPPPAGSDTFTLAKQAAYGGLYAGQKSVDALGIEIPPIGAPVAWQLRMTGPSGNLAVHPATAEMEVEDVILIPGYEWE